MHINGLPHTGTTTHVQPATKLQGSQALPEAAKAATAASAPAPQPSHLGSLVDVKV